MRLLKLVFFSALFYSSCFGNYNQNITESFTTKIIAIIDSDAFTKTSNVLRKTAITFLIVEMTLLLGITTVEIYNYVQKQRKINKEESYVCSHTKL